MVREQKQTGNPTASRTLRLDAGAAHRLLVGVGGIGTGMFFALEGDPTLGRNESRPGKLLDVRDYGKLHIIAHYTAVLLGADPSGSPCHLVPVGKVGADALGEQMRRAMADTGMDTRFVETDPARATLFSVCFQYPDGSGGNITTTDAAASSLGTADIDRAEPFLAAHTGRCQVLAAPEVSLAARDHLLQLATKYDALRAASFTSAEIPAAMERGMLSRIDVLAINEDEGAALVGRSFDLNDPRLRAAFSTIPWFLFPVSTLAVFPNSL